MFVTAYIHTACTILKAYTGSEPFHLYLNKYFAQYKKFGARDRRHIRHICYSYFRLGKSLKEIPVEEKLWIGILLSEDAASSWVAQKNPDWIAIADQDITYKLHYLQEPYHFNPEAIFPFKNQLSGEIDYSSFCISFLSQPHLYLRARPGKLAAVEQKLQSAGLAYELVKNNCIQLPNHSKADSIVKLDEEAVVQDISSQQVLQPLLKYVDKEIKTAWDCCAASGGKSILLKDSFPNIELSVSDIRKNILINLQKRFARAGIKSYNWFIQDISHDNFQCKKTFDFIICDAPCSGSGTWGRTPEQLYFFEVNRIHYYAGLQKKIVSNAIKCTNKEGYFLYITCSVFKEENEAIADYIQQTTPLQLLHRQYYKGYAAKADTLFTALFKRL